MSRRNALTGSRAVRALLGAALAATTLAFPLTDRADAAPVLGLTVSGSASPSAFTYAGSTLTWDLQVKCTSLTENCTNSTISLALPAGVTLRSGGLVNPLGTIDAGSTADLSVSGWAPCATGGGSYDLSATFTADGAAPLTKTSAVIVGGTASCAPPPPPPFSKSGPSVFNPGGRPRYRIVLPAKSAQYVVEDPIPANTKFAKLSVPAPIVAEEFCGAWVLSPSSCAPTSVTKVRFTVPAESSPSWSLNSNFNYAEATVAVIVDASVAPGATVQNTVTVTSGPGTGTTASTGGAGNVAAATPMPQISKWIDRLPGRRTPGGLPVAGSVASDDVIYAVAIDNDFNAGAAGADLVDPVITDLLDADTTFVPGENWTMVTSAPAGCTTPAFATVANFAGTGRTLLRWTFSGCTLVHALESPTSVQIRFTARVVAGTPASTDITNDATVSVNGTPFSICGPSQSADTDDRDGDANATEQRCATTASFALPKLGIFDSSKWVNGAADPATQWSRYPMIGKTSVSSNGYADYRLFMRSRANIDTQDVEIFDILPFAGDTAVSEPTLDRLSEWNQQLIAPITVDYLPATSWDDAKTVNEQVGFTPMSGSDYTVEYSKSTNPCRFDGNQQLKFSGTLPSGCANDWSGNFVGARSFRVRVTKQLARYNGTSKSGDILRIHAKAVTAGMASAELDKVAWNSFGYTVTDVSATEMLTAEPIKVGVRMVANAQAQPSIGDEVWYDEDRDGVQDPEEEGIAGVTVSLYDTTGGLVSRLLTDANGGYRFDGLVPNAGYVIKLDNPSDTAPGGPLSGFVVAPQDAAPGGSNDDAKDSDIALVSGIATMAATAPNAGEHTPTYDAGFWKEPNFSIGNRVWADDDNSGNMNGSETGIDGVKVNLLKKQPDGSYTPVGTDTTTGGGYYRFDGLVLGDYKVVVDPINFAFGQPLDGRRSSSGAAAKNDANTDIDRDDNGVQPAAIADYPVSGVTSGVITLGPFRSEPLNESELSGTGQGAADGRANMTVDFGFITPKFAIGNYVWMDSNRDGVQDAAETGVNGVMVTIYDVDGAPLHATTTANGPDGKPGFYLFDDLLAGTYSVGFTDIPAGHLLTLVGHGTAATDSDADRTTGRTATFVLDESLPTVNATIDGTGLAAGNVLRDIDAGIYPIFSIGNRVWHDINNNSTQDSGEPGIDGVTVDLYAAGTDGTPTGAALATDTTSNGGHYLFTGLVAGDYVVVIRASQFSASAPLDGFFSSGTLSAGETPAAAAESGTDADDNGTRSTAGAFNGAVLSTKIVLGPNPVEPTGEPATPGHTDPSPDAQSNATVDFGFVTMSVGNLVWVDTNNNGVKDGAETGIANVPVRLYRDDNSDGQADGDQLISTHTNSNGQYLFTGLTPGKYLVEITAPMSHFSSSGNPTGYVGPFEPGVSDATAADSNDHGTTTGNVIRSGTITLTAGTEPTSSTESDGLGSGLANPAVDVNTDLTIDFGIVPAASLGDYVWIDNNRNGLQDEPDEPGVNGVTVNLLGPDGTVVRTTVTSAGPDGKPGYYRFDVLPGDYRVEFVLTTLPDGFVVSPANRGSDDTRDSDADQTTGRTATTNLVAGENDPTWDLGVYSLAVTVGNQVWFDTNANGLNDDGPDAGVPGVRVTLRDSNGRIVTKDVQGNVIDPVAVTDAGGFYLFSNLKPGRYICTFEPPVGYQITQTKAGSDDTIDSNGIEATSRTLRGGQSDLTLDLGLVKIVPVVVAPPTTTTTTTAPAPAAASTGVAPAPGPVVTTSTLVPTAKPASLALDADRSGRTVEGNEAKRELAFTGTTLVGTLLRGAAMLLGLGLVLTAIARKRRTR